MPRRLIAAPMALGAVAVGVFAWWDLAEGGAAPTVWYPGALLFLIALAAIARPRHVRRLPRCARWALAGLAAFTVWSFLSVAWAADRGVAWDGANRTLLYLTVFTLFAAVPWTAGQATAMLTALVAVVVAIGAGTLVAAIAGADPAATSGGRLAGPVGYENASAALFLGAFWPAIVLASRREASPAARGLLGAAAGVLLELGVLTQSRGSLIGGAIALVLALWLVRDRGRLVLALGAVAVVTAGSLPALLAVYGSGATDPHDALVRAAIAIVVSAAALVVCGLGSSRLDGRRAPGRGSLLTSRWLVVAVLVVAAGGGVGAALARAEIGPAAGGAALPTRFTPGLDYGRFDLWRVAATQFAHHPLAGAGADNFAQAYTRDRRHHEELAYPHSIVWRTLGQTGLIGGALLSLFFVGAFLAVRRVGDDPARRTVAVAALVSAGYWLAHGSLDWLWELPAVGAPAMAALGIVAGLAQTTAPADVPPRPRRIPALAGVTAIGLGCLAALSYALPALAAHEVERAARVAGDDPAAARRALERGRRLNPLSDRPDVVAGALALREGDQLRARRAFERAVQRNPGNWHSQTQLALSELRAGERATALARLRHARSLNPLEPATAIALDAASRRAPIPATVTEALADSAVPGPLGPRPVSCRPVLGLAAACSRRAGP